jgi:hypothetical protein
MAQPTLVVRYTSDVKTFNTPTGLIAAVCVAEALTVIVRPTAWYRRTAFVACWQCSCWDGSADGKLPAARCWLDMPERAGRSLRLVDMV